MIEYDKMLSFCNGVGISAEEFFLIQTVYLRNETDDLDLHREMNVYYSLIPQKLDINYVNILKNLEKKGLIRITRRYESPITKIELKHVSLTDKCRQLLLCNPEEVWEKFVSLYPAKGRLKDGTTFVANLQVIRKVKKESLLYFILLFALFYCASDIQAKDKFVLVIDAGHGGKDPGAQRFQIDEKDINLSVARKLGDLIESNHNDIRVIYTRKSDRFIELDERANIANRAKADLFISIHTNAVERGSYVTGTETFTLGLARTDENLQVAMRENSTILLEDNYLQKYEGFDPNSSESYIIFEFMQNKHMEQSVDLASKIQKSFTSVNRVDRGVRQAGLLVLRKKKLQQKARLFLMA